MELQDFHEDLLDQVQLNNDSYCSQSSQSIFNIYSALLESSGQFVDDVIEIEYGVHEYHFSAFSRDDERGMLNLMMTKYL